MKKLYLFIIFILVSFAFTSCSTSSRLTSEKVVDIIETLEIKEIDQTFYYELNNYVHIGDAYYLWGEKNDYIELVMYYKQKYVQMIIEFDMLNDTEFVVVQVQVEYIDLLDEIYINFDAHDDEYPYDLSNKTYDGFFEELEALSISDIEWILETLNLM